MRGGVIGATVPKAVNLGGRGVAITLEGGVEVSAGDEGEVCSGLGLGVAALEEEHGAVGGLVVGWCEIGEIEGRAGASEDDLDGRGEIARLFL